MMKIYPATFRYRARRGDQSLLKMRMREIAATRVRYGYRRIHVLLRRAGQLTGAGTTDNRGVENQLQRAKATLQSGLYAA